MSESPHLTIMLNGNGCTFLAMDLSVRFRT